MVKRRVRTIFLAAAALVAAPCAAWAQPAPAASADAAAAEQAAKAGMERWTSQGEAACLAKQPGCERMEEVLFNAAAAYRSVHRVDRAIAVWRLLIDPRHHLDTTELGKRAVLNLARDHQSIGDYEQAATFYEAYAQRAPKEKEAPDALTDAILLRLGLGQIDPATRDAELFAKNYGTKSRARVAQVGLAIADYHVEREAFKDAKKQLGSWMSSIDQSRALDAQILAHTWLARSLAGLGDTPGATAEYTKVRELGRDPQALLNAIEKEDPGNMRRVGKALTGVGEALFFFAEQKRVEVDAVRFPEYKGPGTKESVMQHINTKVGPWVQKKREAIAAAEKEYQKVLQIQPAPPPKWVVASASRVGQMWGRFVAEYRAAPIPAEWRRKGSPPGSTVSYADMRRMYYSALDEASASQKQQAKASFRMCLDSSVKYQYFDRYSRACASWLSKNYRAEYPQVDEFIPAIRGLGSPPFPATPAERRASP